MVDFSFAWDEVETLDLHELGSWPSVRYWTSPAVVDGRQLLDFSSPVRRVKFIFFTLLSSFVLFSSFFFLLLSSSLFCRLLGGHRWLPSSWLSPAIAGRLSPLYTSSSISLLFFFFLSFILFFLQLTASDLGGIISFPF